MDTPKYGFQLLHKFPIDILADIVLFVPGEDIGRLKMTGSKSLWSILRCPNVVKSVDLGKGGIRFKSWPSFVNEFPSLESLYLENSYRQWWSEMSLTIDQLPSTLKNLSFEIIDLRAACDWSSDLFFQIPTTSDAIHLDEHLPLLESLTVWDLEATYFDWVSHCPPSLTSLYVYHWEDKIALPPGLKHFRSSVGMPTAFPLSMESLDCDRYFHSLPCLTSLSASLGTGELVQPEDLGYLPRTLTHLGIQTLPSVAWPSLPYNLQSLSFYATKADCTVLSSVVNSVNGEVLQVETIPLELLPKTLTNLQIYVEDARIFVSGSCSSLFPPRLTTFDGLGLILAPNAAKQLPASLTRLSTNLIFEQLCVHLPEGLTSLLFNSWFMSPKTISRLPKSLTNLHGSFSFSDEEEVLDYKTGKLIPLTSHPEYSVHSDYATYFACLPPSLTRLHLTGFRALQNDFIEHQNFSNLLSLTLWETDQLSDDCIPHLNRHLTLLNANPSPNITGKCFKSLPKSLTFLRLGSSSSIYDEDIQHLPRALQDIWIPSATELSDECIRDVPMGCKELLLSKNRKITLRCIENFPLSMKSFKVEMWEWRYGEWTLTEPYETQ